jgi:uncharacterized membrane protein YcjF (UPF0283 family)
MVERDIGTETALALGEGVGVGLVSKAWDRVRAIELCRNIPLIEAEAVRNGVDFFRSIFGLEELERGEI